MPTPTSIFDCSDGTLKKYRGRRKHLADFPSGIDTIGKMAFFGKKSLESVQDIVSWSIFNGFEFSHNYTMASLINEHRFNKLILNTLQNY